MTLPMSTRTSEMIRSTGLIRPGFYSEMGFWNDVADYSAGLGDALILGLGDELRDYWSDILSVGGVVNPCSNAYTAGAWTSFAIGTGRLAYAGAAKGISVLAKSGAAASAGRQQLKNVLRLGLGKNWRPPNIPKGISDATLRAKAGRTNPWINTYGSGVTGAGAHGGTRGESPWPL